jgi:hypothetical protein
MITCWVFSEHPDLTFILFLDYIGGIINAIGLFKKFSSGSTTALPLAYQNFLKETQPHQILISEDGSALAISQLDTIQLRFDNDDFHMNQFQFKGRSRKQNVQLELATNTLNSRSDICLIIY